MLARAQAFFAAGDYEGGLHATRQGLTAYPEDVELWTLHGLMLRQARRAAEALEALQRAVELSPAHRGAKAALGKVLLDLGRAAEARGVFEGLIETSPVAAEPRVGLGRAMIATGEAEDGLAELRRAIELDPGHAPAWLFTCEALIGKGRRSEALALLETGLAANPDASALFEGAALILVRAGAAGPLEAHLRTALERFPKAAWPHAYLGELLIERDAAAAERHLRAACELEPRTPGPFMALAALLSRARGKRESLDLGEAQAFARRVIELGGLAPGQVRTLRSLLARLWDFSGIERLNRFSEIGRGWARAGEARLLLTQFPWVTSLADRLELLEQHQIAAAPASQAAAAEPLPVRARAPRERIRLGLLSADLRSHPVGLFLEPLFAHRDPRFELFCYDIDPRPEDALKRQFAAASQGFRGLAGAEPRAIAQQAAEDRVDVLIELGGWTGANRPEVLAWGGAPKQLSWLGYPHSSGFAGVDGFICDAANAPTDPGLLAEPPLVLPASWIAFGDAFKDLHSARPVAGERGGVAFGTANAAYKYTPQGLRTWAGIVAALPGSRFVFVRPEAASSIFRANVAEIFAGEGVDPARIDFRAVSGEDYLKHYGEIDVSLDTFPLTGGTTTLEALWMGVPVVTLRGPAFFERLSASILTSAGLSDLIADDLATYRAKALALAADAERRSELRAGLRERLLCGPLGDGPAFAHDVYGLLASVADAPARS